MGRPLGNEATFESLLHHVRVKLFERLPDETWCYPGHGVGSTFTTERPHFDEWHHRTWWTRTDGGMVGALPRG